MTGSLSAVRDRLAEGFSRPVVSTVIVALLVGLGVWQTTTALTAVGASTAVVILLTVAVAGLIPLVVSYLLIEAGL
jgi:hypothetical protein